ncbi:hypothetical protein ACVRXF_06075 [Streptococcus orisasini]
MSKNNVPTLRFKEFDDNWENSIELNSVIKKQFKGKAKLDQLKNGTVMYLDLQNSISLSSRTIHYRYSLSNT